MLIMIDNYDSFTYNIVQYFGILGQNVKVFRNDETSIPELERLPITSICVGPGPCAPAQAGISLEVIKHFAGKVPILGVCLGHQAIGEAFGGKIVRGKSAVHGKVQPITNNGTGVFRGLPHQFNVVRYHSLVIDRASLPDCLEVTATSVDDEIMAVRHKTLQVEGVQFHPESLLSENGFEMFTNFLNSAK